MKDPTWVIFLVTALIISRLIKSSMKKMKDNLPAEKHSEDKEITFEELFCEERIEKKVEKKELLQANIKTKEKVNASEVSDEQSQVLDKQNKERKFNLADAIVYSTILERPYK